MPRILFESDTDDANEEDNARLTINKSYAENYDKWRSKEEYQALKDKYGKVSGSDTESDESSAGGFAEPDNPEFDMDFFRTLAAVNLEHPLLKKGHKFFKDSYESTSRQKPNENKEKLTIQEHEKNLLLKADGKIKHLDVSKNRYQKKDSSILNSKMTKQELILDENISDEGDPEDLFTKPETDVAEEITKGILEQTEPAVKNEALDFLQGKTRTLGNDLDQELLGGLKNHWHTHMSTKEKFIMDFFVNQRYLDGEEYEETETDPHHHIMDIEAIEEDMKTFDKLEKIETKYRFRFEEPDQEFIRPHPRILPNVVRKCQTKRTTVRHHKMAQYQENLEREKQEKLRLRALERLRILDKINILKNASGIDDDSKFAGFDLAADFDPQEHDAAMQKMFNQNYYDDMHPDSNFPELDDDLKEVLQQEYDKLDDLDYAYKGTFKYIDVVPNNYGLTTEEIFAATDEELKNWCSLKVMYEFGKSEERANREYNFYHGRNKTKEKFFPSLFSEDPKSVIAREEEKRRERNRKKKERKIRKQNKNNLENEVEESVNVDENTDLGSKAEETLAKVGCEAMEENIIIPQGERLLTKAIKVSNEAICLDNSPKNSKKKRKRSFDSDQEHLVKSHIEEKRDHQMKKLYNEAENAGDEISHPTSNGEPLSEVDERRRLKKERKLAKKQKQCEVLKESEIMPKGEELLTETKQVSNEATGFDNSPKNSKKKRKHSLDSNQEHLVNGHIEKKHDCQMKKLYNQAENAGDEKSHPTSNGEPLSEVDERRRLKKERKLAKKQRQCEALKESEIMPKGEELLTETKQVSNEATGFDNSPKNSKKKRKHSLDSNQEHLVNGHIEKKHDCQMKKLYNQAENAGDEKSHPTSNGELLSEVDERRRLKKERKLAKKQRQCEALKESEIMPKGEELLTETKQVSNEATGFTNSPKNSKKKHSLNNYHSLNSSDMKDAKQKPASKEPRKIHVQKKLSLQGKKISRKIRNKRKAMAKKRCKAGGLNTQAKESNSIDKSSHPTSKQKSKQLNPRASNTKRNKQYWTKRKMQGGKFDPSLKWIDEISSKRMSAYGQYNPDTSKLILQAKYKMMKGSNQKPSR